MTYVEIAVYVPSISKVFHYHLPPELEGRVGVGHLVIVQFGRQIVQGVILREVDTPAVEVTRPVISLLDPEPVLTPAQIELAQHLSEHNLTPLAMTIGLMLPTGLAQQADILYTLQAETKLPGDLTNLQSRFVALLQQRGALRGRQIDRAIPRHRWRSSAEGLFRRGLLTKTPVLPNPSVKPKNIRTAQLAVSPQIAQAEMENLSKIQEVKTRRAAMLRFLITEPEPVNVSWVYAQSGGNLADLKMLAKKGLVLLGETELWRDPLESIEYIASSPPQLTDAQQNAWDAIRQGLRKSARGKQVAPFLLYGVTGSGKTEVYMQAVGESLRQGKQAIILVPEIALTPQTVRRFMARFPGEVGLIHSRLSPGEQFDTWRRAREGKISIIVGPRSALFAPLPNLGLLVVDEFHDSSYYQSEMPFYHARDAAVAYADLAGAVCVLGSATPGVNSRFHAERGKWMLLQLPKRILAHRETVRAHLEKVAGPKEIDDTLLYAGLPREVRTTPTIYSPENNDAQTADLPPVRVVDMRQELKAGNRSIFSRALQETLGQVLEQGQQAILFLNRRGTATYVFCRDCGHAMKCPRCDDISLTYHSNRKKLTCHHCNYERNLPKVCPVCGSDRIRHYGTGTERVENEVQALFPNVRTLRWDSETTRKKGAHELILHHFANQQADILIGTQMLAKGLDLPLVTLVGIVLADVGLNLPDYRAGERTFQVLSQVAGRAGRSILGGQVVLQTFDPQHYVIQSVANHDYDGFYQRELAYRQELGFPPFTRLVRLEYRNTDNELAEQAAHELATSLKNQISREQRRQTEVIGPAPCFFGRLDTHYRWQIILRGPDPVSMLQNRRLADWRVEVNPQSLL